MNSNSQHEGIHSTTENFSFHDTVASKDPSKDPNGYVHRARILGTRKSALKGPRRSELNGTTRNGNRFNKTIAVLQFAGLLGIVTQTSKLLEENIKLQKEIDQLEQATLAIFRRTLKEDSEDLQAGRKQSPEANKVIH